MTDHLRAPACNMAIIGAGTYGEAIAELAESCGYDIGLYLDDDPNKRGIKIGGVDVAGPIDAALVALPRSVAVAVAIGNNDLRIRWMRAAVRLGHYLPALISGQALVSRSATVEDGVYLHPGCHVWTQAQVGFGSILSPQATVAHHTVLGEGCFVSSGANVGASIRVGECAFFGIGSVTSTGVSTVAAHSLIGAGAVIIRDTQPFGVYVGSPGRLLRVDLPKPASCGIESTLQDNNHQEEAEGIHVRGGSSG